jgi:AcrR family transcriptional regulator
MSTKDRILETALNLFNQQGTSAVSTNHIAEVLSISPGNLYYHFRSKDDIIRALFERLFDAWDVSFALPHDCAPTLDDLRGLARINFEILWRYRFAYREMIALIRQDAVLRERYLEVRARGYTGFHEMFVYLKKLGLLTQAVDETTVTRLADLCWLISEFWLSALELRGQEISEANLEHGITLMIEVLRPYAAL